MEILNTVLNTSGIYNVLTDFSGQWKSLAMVFVSLFLLYLAIKKKFEPLLLVPIAFGMLMSNLPLSGVFVSPDGTEGIFAYFFHLDELGIIPALIFLGVGAMTDFGPLLAFPRSILLGAAAQIGIFATFVAALTFGFSPQEASSIAIIGGADGPTTIYVAAKLAPHLLASVAVAAYSYMALIPVIQTPIMKLLTTKEERQIQMVQLREVSNKEKIIFSISVVLVTGLLVPSAITLIGMLMLGNLFRECGVVARLTKTSENELINIATIILGLSVGGSAQAATFLTVDTLIILSIGIIAFAMGTAGGLLMAKVMNIFSKEPVNPLIGSAGVSAVPMAARVSQKVGQAENPSNFLLMHAMGPNVAGVIGSAIVAGIFLAFFT